MTLVRRLAAAEIAQYRSLIRWLTRRPVGPEGASAFPYVGEVSVLLWAFVIGSAVELVVLHVVLPWESVRLVADVLGVWGLVFMVGLMADLKVHPHLVVEEGLVVRDGHRLSALLPWAAIASVQQENRSHDKGVRDDGTLAVPVGNRTTVLVTLRRGMEWDGRTVRQVRLLADDATGLVSASREAMTSHGAGAR